MLSSPGLSPARGVDTARLSFLPDRSKKSLEWACAKARTSSSHDNEKENKSPLPTTDEGHKWQDERAEEDTDTEEDEAVTPDTSADVLPVPGANDVSKMHKSKDMEAAMALLDFMRR